MYLIVIYIYREVVVDLIEEYKAAEKADYVSWVTNSAIPPSNTTNTTMMNNSNTNATSVMNESRMYNNNVTLDSRIYTNTSQIVDT